MKITTILRQQKKIQKLERGLRALRAEYWDLNCAHDKLYRSLKMACEELEQSIENRSGLNADEIMIGFLRKVD